MVLSFLLFLSLLHMQGEGQKGPLQKTSRRVNITFSSYFPLYLQRPRFGVSCKASTGTCETGRGKCRYAEERRTYTSVYQELGFRPTLVPGRMWGFTKRQVSVVLFPNVCQEVCLVGVPVSDSIPQDSPSAHLLSQSSSSICSHAGTCPGLADK